ncbi:hypothetical protein D3C71_1677190 [compost metagenome]
MMMSISLSASRYWPTGTPVSTACVARAMALVVTPSARALSWSISRRSILTFSFQLSFTPTVFGLAAMIARTWSAILRTPAASGPITRNCTGYATGGPFGSSFTRPRSCGNWVASTSITRLRSASRASTLTGITITCATLLCGKIWSSGR